MIQPNVVSGGMSYHDKVRTPSEDYFGGKYSCESEACGVVGGR